MSAVDPKRFVDLMRPVASSGLQLYRCCICFEALPHERLTELPGGGRVDVCMPCTHDEALYMDSRHQPVPPSPAWLTQTNGSPTPKPTSSSGEQR